MRKVVAYELLSLDGVAEEPQEFVNDWDDAMNENLKRVIATQDIVVLGRRTYNDWAAYWPDSENEPFSGFINKVQKLVITSTPLTNEWSGSSVVEGDPIAYLQELILQPGGDIGIHGSIKLLQSLLENSLVDELRLVIAPAFRFQGRKLFENVAPGRLSLTRSVTSPTGYLLLDYSLNK